jgi:hypothetical protein
MKEQSFGIPEPKVLEGEILPPLKPVKRAQSNQPVSPHIFSTQMNFYEAAPNPSENIYFIKEEAPTEDPLELLGEMLGAALIRGFEAADRRIDELYNYRQKCRAQKPQRFGHAEPL